MLINPVPITNKCIAYVFLKAVKGDLKSSLGKINHLKSPLGKKSSIELAIGEKSLDEITIVEKVVN